MSTNSKSAQQNPDAMLIAGLQKNTPNLALILASQQQSLAQVVAVLQGRVDDDQTVRTAKAAYDTAVQTRNTNLAATQTYVHDVRQAVKAMFSNSPQTLADFGMVPNKPRTPLTVGQKVLAAAKAKATRTARGTLGKNQKAKISGSVPGPVTVELDGSTRTEASGPTGSASIAASAAAPSGSSSGSSASSGQGSGSGANGSSTPAHS
jgi:hypothetical protein